jgi:hypothetical protein
VGASASEAMRFDVAPDTIDRLCDEATTCEPDVIFNSHGFPLKNPLGGN